MSAEARERVNLPCRTCREMNGRNREVRGGCGAEGIDMEMVIYARLPGGKYGGEMV